MVAAAVADGGESVTLPHSPTSAAVADAVASVATAPTPTSSPSHLLPAPGSGKWRDACIVTSVSATVACLPVLAAALPSGPFGLVPPLGLAALTLLCLFAAYSVVDTDRKRSELQAATRRRIAKELADALAELGGAEERACRAEERRQKDAAQLADACAELDAYGTADDRTSLLGASDKISTLAAERAWYKGQLAAAHLALEKHRTRGETLRETDSPALRAQVTGLEAALEEASSQTRLIESTRQSVDSNAAQLGKEVDQLRSHYRAQQEELQRLDSELQALRESAEEGRKLLLEETNKQMRLLGREVTMDERQIRWIHGEKRTTEADNELLRDAVAEKDRELETIAIDIERAEAKRAALECDLSAAHRDQERLEDAARERGLAEKEAARVRELRERAQSSLEDLRTELRLAKAARDRAERDALKAEKNAEEQEVLAKKQESESDAQRAQRILQLEHAARAYKEELAGARRVHAALTDAKKKADDLCRSLGNSAQERDRLRQALVLAGSCKGGEDA